MSLDATRMANAMSTALQAAPINAQPGAALTAFCLGLAQAVVDEITGHAVVTPTSLAAPPGGGPVTGTGAVT